MTKYISTNNLYQCAICGKEVMRRPYEIKRLVDKRVTCSKACTNIKKQLMEKEKMEHRLNIKDFASWLEQKYWEEQLSVRAISELVYGNRTNSPNILGWMERFNIPTRKRSDAVALQWVDNPERREAQKECMERIWKKDTDGKLRAKIVKAMQSSGYKKKASKLKMGELNGMYGVIGRNHPKWNPALTMKDRINRRKIFENDVWRKEVYERDNYTCQVCRQSPSGCMVAHHLNGYHWDIESRFHVDNGITLCEYCHKEFHSEYGYGNNTKEQFAEYQNKHSL